VRNYLSILLLLLIWSSDHQVASAQCSTCTYQFTGTGNNYNLNGNETLCIVSGTFTGNINFNGAGNVICVSDGAVFRPSNLNNANGVLINNYGTFAIQNAFSFGAGTVVNNYNTVQQNSNFNFNGATTLYNAPSAVWTIQPNFILQNNSSFLNDGQLFALAEFSSNQGTSFTNNNRVVVSNNFNPGGNFNNYGFLRALGFININSNSVVRNYCTMYSDQGFNNNSGFTQNFGLIWVTNSNALVQNNAPYFQAAGALTRGERYINSSTVTGSGSYYFTKNTRNQGPFGQDGLGINFYDVSGASGKIFDVENTVPHASVVAIPFVPNDTTQVYAGCANRFVAPLAFDTAFIANINEPILIDLRLISLDSVSTINYAATDIDPNQSSIDSVFIAPGRGTFTLQPSGHVLFVPEPNFTGRALMNFTVINAQGFRSNIGNVEVVVENTSPLPVELLYFNATANGQQTLLSWATASEFNSDYFEVLRSNNGIDFTVIGRVEAAGFSAAKLEYTLVDEQPLEGENYYRLKQVDFDGTTEFFRIVNLFFGTERKAAELLAFPNPAASVVRLKSSLTAEAILVFDLSGSLVLSVMPQADDVVYELNVSELKSGMYIVQVQTASGLASTKLMVQ
jgi:Secretion system C-terminal sorting domain/Bacterial Ig domain